MAIGKTIAVCGYYNQSNMGDDLMADHLSQIFSQNGRNQVQVYSDKNGAEGSVLDGRHGAITACDVIVIGGGGIVTPQFWAFRNGQIKYLQDAKKLIAFVNVNVTEELLYDTTFTAQIKSLGARWWVRDKASVEMLRDIGVQASWLPDVTFRSGILPAKQPHETNSDRVATVFLNSYALDQMIAPKDVDGLLRAQTAGRIIAHHLDWLTAFGWHIDLVSAQTAPLQDDRICSGAIYRLMEHRTSATWVAEPENYQRLLQRILKSDLVVSMRFHASTIALVSGVPFIDITHHDKNRRFLNELGLQPLSADFYTLSHESLIQATQAAEHGAACTPDVDAFRAEAHRRWNLFDQEWDQFVGSI